MTDWSEAKMYMKLLFGKSPEEIKALYEQKFEPPSSVFLEGYKAASNGSLKSSCPFRSHQSEWDEWMKGWRTFGREF